MAVDSMLRRANRAQAGIQRLHDRALVGAERSRVGIRLGLRALSKPDDDMGTSRGENVFSRVSGWAATSSFSRRVVKSWRDVFFKIWIRTAALDN
jgi:hypothetical protein